MLKERIIEEPSKKVVVSSQDIVKAGNQKTAVEAGSSDNSSTLDAPAVKLRRGSTIRIQRNPEAWRQSSFR